ncbi:hypothetical protein M409DRAFT_24535 [Zasmidium cellare ATCC 36951]|uniref:Epoxide hydrolase N-terminal domain-containing protein n=1 Tax=Zasmidium cellare ATCC 36951 TaxID=1080233 RepID=A0A6A6CIC0_ZASCE|nr:uncharacterized protein M409DRAFT_24535 [Zasmidium cellare ATCC 36951]KAF2165146.1 hypothetical protein M409DRAFT_24535 [Zasmidium cellare ATCC 36951]
MADYGKVPAGVKFDIKPFKAHVEDQKIQDFKTLLKLSPVAPPVYENSDKSVERRYGTPRDWLINAKENWLNSYDWRKTEDRINSFPNFTAQVKDDVGHDLTIHFIALFSQKPDATPLALYHGWPGSFLEFLQILDLLKQKYSPQDLPYHVIVPSIPGYAYSSGPPLNYDYALENASEALNNLMLGLGFSGYVAQGGDLGSFISRYQAATNDACKGMHLNFSPIPRPQNADELPIEDVEKQALGRGLWFRDYATAYAQEHGTRTATIGHALSASPLALLSWIGEKFLEWTDEDPPLQEILDSVTLYWMTETFPRCIYPYRGLSGGDERPRIASASGRGRERPHVSKPSGYSFFPKELVPMPKSWVAQSCNLVSAKVHTSGGHFAAMEKPKELLEDVEEYIKTAFKGLGGKL